MDHAEKTCCGIVVTRKIKTLSLAFSLFILIASSQLVGALLANSMALLADTASMFLDAATYAVNIYAECQPKEDKALVHKRMLIASGVSFFALLIISSYFLIDAATTIASGKTDGEEVDYYIVFGFAVVGLLFDVASLLPYYLYGVDQGDHDDAAGKMNMCSALSHIVSDTLRSITTLVESLLIWFGHINGDLADEYAAVIVSSLIIAGLGKSIYEWGKDVYALWNETPKTGIDRDMKEVVGGENLINGREGADPSEDSTTYIGSEAAASV